MFKCIVLVPDFSEQCAEKEISPFRNAMIDDRQSTMNKKKNNDNDVVLRLGK